MKIYINSKDASNVIRHINTFNKYTVFDKNLRGIKYKEDIFYELDEIDAFIFVQDGSYKIGYKMNYKTKFRLINGSGSYIGGFEVTFDRQSSYDYQGLKPMNVFYIR